MAGFRRGYSTTDPIYVTNQVVKIYAEYTKPLCMAFMDYEKAFGSVKQQLWKLSGDSKVAVAARSCRRSFSFALAFESVVEIDPLSRDTGPPWHPEFPQFTFPWFLPR